MEAAPSHSLFSAQFSSVGQPCPTLCDPMDCSTIGLPVNHQPPEFTQTHIHWVGDAVQPSHPLLKNSFLHPFFSYLQSSQHQGLFKWVSSLPQAAKVLEFQYQHQSFQWRTSNEGLPMKDTQDWSSLGRTGCISLQSPWDSQESSPTPQFKTISPSVLIFLYSPTLKSIHD